MFGILFKVMNREAGMEVAKKGYTEPYSEIINAVGDEDFDEILAILSNPIPLEQELWEWRLLFR